jgi:amino-acid N-acetyltransferase
MSASVQLMDPAVSTLEPVIAPLAAEPLAAGSVAAQSLAAPSLVAAAVVAESAVTAPEVAIRPARMADIPQIADLLETYARLGLVLPRPIGMLYRHMREFLVAVEGERVIGCGALRLYSPVLAEVCALAVAESCRGKSVGRRIVEALVEEARAFGVRRVFAMTLQESFFNRLGFRTVPMTEVPEKIEADRQEGIDRAKCMKATVVRDLEY